LDGIEETSEVRRVFDDRGLVVLEEVYDSTSDDPLRTHVWERDANGEVILVEAERRRVEDRSGYRIVRDDRGMVVRQSDLFGGGRWEFDVSPTTCTWDTKTRIEGTQPVAVVEMDWWHERPSRRVERPLLEGGFVQEHRTRYDRGGLIRRSESRIDGILTDRQEHEHNDQGLPIRKLSWGLWVDRTGSSNPLDRAPVEEAGSSDATGREDVLTKERDGPVLERRETAWAGALVERRSPEFFQARGTRVEVWEGSGP